MRLVTPSSEAVGGLSVLAGGAKSGPSGTMATLTGGSPGVSITTPSGVVATGGATGGGDGGGSVGLTTAFIVCSSSPQSIDQLPSSTAEAANRRTTNILTAARNATTRMYHSRRHG